MDNAVNDIDIGLVFSGRDAFAVYLTFVHGIRLRRRFLSNVRRSKKILQLFRVRIVRYIRYVLLLGCFDPNWNTRYVKVSLFSQTTNHHKLLRKMLVI